MPVDLERLRVLAEGAPSRIAAAFSADVVLELIDRIEKLAAERAELVLWLNVQVAALKDEATKCALASDRAGHALAFHEQGAFTAALNHLGVSDVSS